MPLSKVPSSWKSLVEDLERAGTVRTPNILRAFRDTPRSLFVPEERREEADRLDLALPIGCGQTISQPTTVAMMLELVQPHEGETVLDVGTGSGWQAALLARAVGPQGHVDTIERIPFLAEQARRVFQKESIEGITSFIGDAFYGLPNTLPFDVIVVAAASDEIPPTLLTHLAPHGRLLQPIVGKGLRLVRKNSTLTVTDIPGFVFVPFIHSGEEPKRL